MSTETVQPATDAAALPMETGIETETEIGTEIGTNGDISDVLTKAAEEGNGVQHTKKVNSTQKI
jgi:hypothetical protein